MSDTKIIEALKTSSTMVKIIVGGFVADAAAMPTHWIYDIEKLKEILGPSGMKNPAFFEKLSCPYYSSEEFNGHYEKGMASPYGEQGWAVLDYLRDNNGTIESGEAFANYLFDWGVSYTGRKDHATSQFLEAAEKLKAETKALYPEAGADDMQANCFSKVAQVFARYGGSPEYHKKIEYVVRAHQNNDKTVDYALALGIILDCLVIQGMDMEAAIQVLLKDDSKLCSEVKDATRKGWDAKTKANIGEDGWDTDLKDWGAKMSYALYHEEKNQTRPKSYETMFALVCRFPQSYFSSLKIIGDTLETFGGNRSNDEFKNKAYEFAVNRNIKYGGDACGRSFIIGSIMAALGAEVPNEFLLKTKNADQIISIGTMLEQKNEST